MPSFSTLLRKVMLVFSVAIAGCSSMPEHSNTLVFGTSTKFAIDLSTSSTTQTPELTVGYKRTEAVWLPLLANLKSSNGELIPNDCSGATCLFNSTETRDAYSVLASFGAEFGGEGKTNVTPQPSNTGGAPSIDGSSKASGGIAQYFATGLAAQLLAKEGGASLVTIQSGNEVSQKSPQQYLMDELNISAEESKQLLEMAVKNQNRKEVLIEEVMKKLAPSGTVNQEKVTAVSKELTKKYPGLGSAKNLETATTETEIKAIVTRLANVSPRDGQEPPFDVLVNETFK
ncbi:hypothetical protein SAMN06297280_3442 [Arsukibacterium tuosuense]|uniref:Lipoprotein n=1 Tax=Arsukibacterium tuosuense TaxID=1323745 RepID=A0A285JHI6_9GAMM|nr:hypothetical protein [Arsukibacterium tuosuense]SNY58591.1 hypothetical protein SAMN06297280_3442 [Arsukibacterium tuosuense]